MKRIRVNIVYKLVFNDFEFIILKLQVFVFVLNKGICVYWGEGCELLRGFSMINVFVQWLCYFFKIVGVVIIL